MKNILILFLILLLNIKHAYSTGQQPDYLIIEKDTFEIFSNPLGQYFELNKYDFIQEIVNPFSIIHHSDGSSTELCYNSACWRGYEAYWKLENDSLKLVKIIPCCSRVELTSEEIIYKIFGKNNVFGNWYTGSIIAPYGQLFSGSDMGYNAIYENEFKFTFENGILKSKSTFSNLKWIEEIKLDHKLYDQIKDLKDTLIFNLKKLNWKKLDDSNCYCSDSYILSYTKHGKLNSVELIKNIDDSTTIAEKIYLWSFDKKCSNKIESALKKLSLSYLNAHRDFKIQIKLYYSKQLIIQECYHYFKPITEKEIENYVKKQMDSNGN